MKETLELAKECFNSLRLLESYRLFKRFFDRLPFKYEEEHARYFGLYLRLLQEMGKDFEVKFYANEIERLHRKDKSLALGYAVARVYLWSTPVQWELARAILEEILIRPPGLFYENGAKLLLAKYYLEEKGDLSSAKTLVHSIRQGADFSDGPLVTVWHAIVLREEGEWGGAEKLLKAVIKENKPNVNWYPHFSAKIVLGNLYRKMGKRKEAEALLEEVEEVCRKHLLKGLGQQAETLRKSVVTEKQVSLQVIEVDGIEKLHFGATKLTLDYSRPWQRLLSSLLVNRAVGKEGIIRDLYGREYVKGEDDKLIYYHVHALRSQLDQIGIPPSTLLREKDSYRLRASIERKKEQ